MTEQVPQKADPESLQHAAEVAAVLAVLQSGPPLATATRAISVVLKAPGKLVLAVLAGILKYKPGKKSPIGGTRPEDAAKKGNRRYRAAYLINAIKRLAEAPDLKAALAREKTLFTAHKKASTRRIEAAKTSGKLSDITGNSTLGWGGVLDNRTTPDCRWLIGKNYDVANPPEGLHPGGRHPKCRCFPAPPFPGKPVVTTLPAQL
ncbi:MAG: hypothetical protein JWN15_3467 [Firmicutes bacterium]|nr:hypothetical protein [Bacillota bacterium]